MNDLFMQCVNRLIDVNEKGYSNRKDDLGGETMYGITKSTAKANGYAGDMRKLTQKQAIAIYKKGFWDKSKLDDFKSHKIAFLVFDANVNHGVNSSAKMLQRAINRTYNQSEVVVDGIVGQKTIAAVNGADENVLIFNLTAERLRFFTSIKKTWEANCKGWINRVSNNLNFISTLD